MDCKKVQTLITAAVDRELDEPTMQAFLAALNDCPDCRAEYESELAMKQLLKNRLKKVDLQLHYTVCALV